MKLILRLIGLKMSILRVDAAIINPKTVKPNGYLQVENYADIPEGFLDKNTCIIDILGQTRHAWGAVHNKVFKSNIFDNICFPEVRHLEDYVVTIHAFNEANMICCIFVNSKKQAGDIKRVVLFWIRLDSYSSDILIVY